ncbi:MAG: argininosuccinate synthase [Candidatus Omnitrophota bacterium]|nr:MAG: argininosuccinate synthase [Candidatus Omnitrophota bacterium]
MMAKKVILAYSGGLDTSVAVKWLKEKGFDVICYLADVGQGQNFQVAKKRAKAAGASKMIIGNLKKEFVEEFIWPSLKANAAYESKYFLATAISRPLIAKKLVEVAHKEGAKFVAHGCTGKGNDQVRFEVSVGALDSELEVIAPVREWNLPTREAEMRYAKLHKIPVDVTKKKPYSIDKNLWGVSIESGELEDPWLEPKESAYQMTKPVGKSPNKPCYLRICFQKGIPKKINGKSLDGIKLINKLNEIGGKYSVGRSDLIEDRLVGIKSRELYEAPAANILLEAHKALEGLVLDRETLYFKEIVALRYSRLIYDGLWYTPLKEAIDRFVDYTQGFVEGAVNVKLLKGNISVVGRKSPNSLYKKELATYGKGDKFDQSLAKGFIELWGLPYKKH